MAQPIRPPFVQSQHRPIREDAALLLGAASLTGLAVLRNPVSSLLTLSQVGLLGLAVVACMLTVKSAERPQSVLQRFCVALPGIFAAWLGLSTVYGFLRGADIDLVQCARDLRDLVVFASGYTALAWLYSGRRHRLVVGAMIGVGVAMSLELVARGSSVYSMLFEPMFMGYRPRAGLLGPNEYGALASIVAAMAFGLALGTRNSMARLGSVLLMGVALAAVVGTLSRGGMGGTALAVTLLLGVYLWDAFASMRPSRIVGLIGVAATIALLGVAVLSPVRRLASGAVTMASRRLAGSDVQSGLGDRERLLGAAVSIGADHPLLGSGMGSFSSQNSSRGGTGTLSPHNELAKAFAEGGVVGASLLASWYVCLLVVAVRGRHAPGGYAILGGVVAFLVAEQFFTYLVRPGLSVVMAFVLASVQEVGVGHRTRVRPLHGFLEV